MASDHDADMDLIVNLYNGDALLLKDLATSRGCSEASIREEAAARLAARPSSFLQSSPQTPTQAPSSSHQQDNNRFHLSTVLYLSMLHHDAEIMYTTARLYLHLTSTVERKRQARTAEWIDLQFRHEQELSTVLAMADSAGTVGVGSGSGSLVVDAMCTESVFQRHAKEVEELTAFHRCSAIAALQEANDNFHSFLQAAAPDHLTHSLMSVHPASNSSAVASSPIQCSPVCQFPVSDRSIVDVLVMRIINPLRGQVVGARPKDPALAAIVLEASPLSSLEGCNRLALRRYVDEDHQDRLARKVQDHLTRIASGAHSLLVMIGSEDEALQALGLAFVDQPAEQGAATNRGAGDDATQTLMVPPELILPLPSHSAAMEAPRFHVFTGTDMKWLTTSQLYAANHIILIPPPTLSDPSSAAKLHTSLEHTLHVALSHSVNRYSVAVLPSASGADAMVLYELHKAVASIQMSMVCGKPPSTAGLTISGLLRGSTEWMHNTQLLYTAVGQAQFNIPLAIRVFLSTAPMEMALSDAFGRDVEVVARTQSVA